jgi:hypothetical protein
MIAKRINYRGGGGYQGGPTGSVERSGVGGISGPAGGASAGGNYGGNVNPAQTYGGNMQTVSGGDRYVKDDPMLAEKTDYVGETIFGPTQKYTGANRFFGGANKYGYQDQYVDPNKANFGQVKPGYGGRIFGGLMSLLTGIPFTGGAIGTAYDKGLGIFRDKYYDDMSQYNRLGLFGVDPVLTDNYSDMKINDTSFVPNNINTSNFTNPPGQMDDTGVNYSVGNIQPNETYTIDELIPYENTIPTADYIPPYMAEVTQKDIDASKMRGFNTMDRQTAIDLGIISPNVTEYEFQQLKQGNITSPGSYQV